MRRFTPAGIALASACLLASVVQALDPAERELLVKSIRSGQLATVESATGGLDKLPLLMLDLDLDLEARHAGGSAKLNWRNTTGTTLSSLPIRVSANSTTPDGPKATWAELHVTMPSGERIAAAAKSQSADILIVTLPKPLAPNEHVVLDGKIDAVMSKIAPGSTDPVHASMSALSNVGAPKPDGQQYGTFACGDAICTLSGFTPEVPAFINGQFDLGEASGIGDATYSEPLNMLMGVVVHSGVTLAVTGVEIGHVPVDNHRVRWTYAMAATREVAIVASSSFAIQTVNQDGIHIRSYALKTDAVADKIVLKAGSESVANLEKAFGKYPWSFLNLAEGALVGGAGGVELPGMAVIGSGFYHRDANGQTNAMLALVGGIGDGLFDQMLDFITRHEVAHQWWHAEVGSHSQLHPYIDEPLAQWSALYSTRQSKGPKEGEHARTLQVAMNFQALSMFGANDGKVARSAGEFASQIEYAGLVYGKAPLFYDAAAKKFGEDKVLAGLRALVEEKRFKRATPDDVLLALCHAVGPTLAPQMHALWKRWFEETHGVDDIGPLDIKELLTAVGLPPGMLGANSDIKLDPATVKALLGQMKELTGTMGNLNDPALSP